MERRERWRGERGRSEMERGDEREREVEDEREREVGDEREGDGEKGARNLWCNNMIQFQMDYYD